jgi:hypothetical protein
MDLLRYTAQEIDAPQNDVVAEDRPEPREQPLIPRQREIKRISGSASLPPIERRGASRIGVMGDDLPASSGTQEYKGRSKPEVWNWPFATRADDSPGAAASICIVCW